MKNRISAFGFGALGVVLLSISSFAVAGESVVAYPEKGQSSEKQASDTAACKQFATSQTGFDPQKALENAPPHPPTPTAVRPRKRAKEEKQELAVEGEEQQSTQQKLKEYNKAESVCLKGRGYSVG